MNNTLIKTYIHILTYLHTYTHSCRIFYRISHRSLFCWASATFKHKEMMMMMFMKLMTMMTTKLCCLAWLGWLWSCLWVWTAVRSSVTSTPSSSSTPRLFFCTSSRLLLPPSSSGWDTRDVFGAGGGFNRFDLGAQELIARLLHSGCSCCCCWCCCSCCCSAACNGGVAICKIETLQGTPCGSFNQINCALLLLLLPLRVFLCFFFFSFMLLLLLCVTLSGWLASR